MTLETCLDIKHFHLNEFLKGRIECFILRGYKFSHITEMNIETFSNKRNMSYEYFIRTSMIMVERRLKMKIAKNPHLIIALNRHFKHPLT